jgi:general secretion pathway protein B
MSYILEALKKAEQERHLGQIPPLTQPHTPLFSAAAESLSLQRATAWLMGSALLIALGAGTLGHWYAQKQNTSHLVSSKNRDSSVEQVASDSPAIANKEALKDETQKFILPSTNATTDTIIHQSNTETPSRPLTDMLIVTTPEIPKTPPKDTQKDTQTVVTPPPAPKSVTPPPVARVVKPTETVSIPIVEPIPETQALPLFQELPARLQQRLSPLLIDVHVYAESPQQRFVLINGRRYREGMDLRKDLTLLQIRPTDIILRHQNQLFRLTAQD